MKITNKKLRELEKELENKIYNNGYYSKMCGSNDIKVTYNENISEDYIEEFLDGETKHLVLSFKVEHLQEDENGGSTDWWNIDIELDKELNFKAIKGGED